MLFNSYSSGNHGVRGLSSIGNTGVFTITLNSLQDLGNLFEGNYLDIYFKRVIC